MRVRVLSDLHLEFGPAQLPDVDCDCVVLAGDISTKQHGLEWIRGRFPDLPAIYICGNHEFYGDKHPRVIERLREASRGTSVHVLENEHVSLGDMHFFGCTMWTDFELHGDREAASDEAGQRMNDYKRIRNSSRGFKKLRPHDTWQAHRLSLHALESFLNTHDPAKSVIVTHHAPSILSLPEHRRGLCLSAAYASRLDELILKHQPALWIHGHIHVTNDYQVGRTRVVANPRGYPESPNVQFVPGWVIEL